MWTQNTGHAKDRRQWGGVVKDDFQILGSLCTQSYWYLEREESPCHVHM